MGELTLEEKIRAAGFRATKPRLQILSFLKNRHKPESIQDIAISFRRKIDPVTIYRVIDSFKKRGLVREVDLQLGRPLYEIAGDDHHHITCTNCARVEDFTGCHADSLAKTALSQTKQFASIKSHSIELFGLCNKCTV